LGKIGVLDRANEEAGILVRQLWFPSVLVRAWLFMPRSRLLVCSCTVSQLHSFTGVVGVFFFVRTWDMPDMLKAIFLDRARMAVGAPTPVCNRRP
jgi:hypothetical protein